MNTKDINNPDKTVDHNFKNKFSKGKRNEGIFGSFNVCLVSQNDSVVVCSGCLDGPAIFCVT